MQITKDIKNSIRDFYVDNNAIGTLNFEDWYYDYYLDMYKGKELTGEEKEEIKEIYEF